MSDGMRFQLVEMEINTGADPTTMTIAKFKQTCPHLRIGPATAKLINFDGSPVEDVIGAIDTKIRLNGKTHRDYVHIVPNHYPTVLGKNFLQPLNVTVHCNVGNVTNVDTQTTQAIPPQLVHYPRLLDDSIGTYPDSEHRIRLNGDPTPMAAKLRPIPLARREEGTREIQRMEQAGIWEKVDSSQWVHPAVTVSKLGGKVRVTTDLTSLNKHVIPDRYPIPNIKDLLLEVSGAKLFSKLDLKKAYFNIQLSEESRHLTTTLTPEGLYQYRRLPMGLKDSALAFQRRLMQTLHGCKGTIVYIDDILVFGRDT